MRVAMSLFVVCGLSSASLVHAQGHALREGMEVFDRAARASDDATRTALYERAALLLLEWANADPTHPTIPVALENAAYALEQAGRRQSAHGIHQRIVDTIAPLHDPDPVAQMQLDRAVARAYFRLGYEASRSFEDDGAIRAFRMLVDSPRFARSPDDEVRRFRNDAAHNLAMLYERGERWSDAARAYRLLADLAHDDRLVRIARFRVGELAWRSGDQAGTVRAFSDFLTRYAHDSESGALRVRARWRIAQAREGQTSHAAALRDVVAEHAHAGLSADHPASEHAAEASFRLVPRFSPARIRLTGNARRVRAELVSRRDRLEREVGAVVAAYDAVLAHRHPRWSARAWVERGRAYEAVERAIRDARMPRALAESMREELRAQAEPFRCLARMQYARAAQLGHAAALDDPELDRALVRLTAGAACPDEPARHAVPRGLSAPVGPTSPPLAR